MAVFTFCPKTLVPETLPPEAPKAMSFNGWTFTSKPAVPYQRKFKITLHGLTWYLNPTTGLYDLVTNPTYNAKLLEDFYAEHGLWKSFDWGHPHIGTLNVRFNEPVVVPAAIASSGGLIEPFEIVMIEHNPGY